jgi:nicotinamide riboside transporter PnuC
MSGEGRAAILAGRHPLVWGAAFGLGLVLTAWLERSGRIEWPWNVAMIAFFSLALVPLALAARNRAHICGIASPALDAYNRRAMIWTLGYVAALGLALTARNAWHPGGPVLWLLALLPSLAIGYYVWSLGRYLVEETDEYLRMRQIQAGMFATGLLLMVASTWGFLETFGVAPHAEGWWSVAIFAIGQGLAGLWLNARDRRDAGQ